MVYRDAENHGPSVGVVDDHQRTKIFAGSLHGHPPGRPSEIHSGDISSTAETTIQVPFTDRASFEITRDFKLELLKQKRDEVWKLYLEEVLYLDQQLARLFDAVGVHNPKSSTIALTSDHGEEFGSTVDLSMVTTCSDDCVRPFSQVQGSLSRGVARMLLAY